MISSTSPEIQYIESFSEAVERQRSLIEWAESERIQSAIPKPLWDANIELLRGDFAQEYLLGDKLASFGGHSNQYATKPVRDLLKRYENLRDGIWAFRGEGVPYCKPINPRPDWEKPGKSIKYETAPGAIASPILPLIDEETAARYGVEPGDYWHWVLTTNQPLVITEGLKKALALIAAGIPAIAIRGITQWHLKGGLELHPEIAQFATEGRTVRVIFDQDTKLKTIADVHREARKLGNALEAKGCKVFVPQWPASEGKGVDDCLHAQGNNAQSWLDGVLKNALTLKQYKRNGQIIAALNTIKRYNSLSFAIERDTEGEYMPELPTLTPGVIHVVTANMNSGKTVRIGADWVQWALANGYHVLVLAPLNSLGQQTAKDWGIEHIHNQQGNERQFWDAVRERPGVVLCPDSINKIPQWFWEKPVLFVLDEANQVTKHIAQGDTLKSRYSPVSEAIESAAKHAIASGGAIILSEDGIPDRCVKFWQSVSGATTVRCFRHKKQGIPWNVSLYEGNVSGFRNSLLEAMRRGEPILFVTTSQLEAERLERIIHDLGNVKVTRIDSETNEGGAYKLFFDDPNQWLKLNQPNVLIFSPSVKTGVTIEGGVSAEDAYFSQVWGYFPSLDTDAHMQLLGRYRPPVPRHIFVAPYILGDADEGQYSVHATRKRLEDNLAYTAKLLDAVDDGRESSEIESAILDYLAESAVVSGSQKAIAKEALIDRLESAGHSVNPIGVAHDKIIAELWKDTQEAIWQDKALEAAQMETEDHPTPEWAHRTLDSMESTRAERILANKVLWRDEFPGVLFDSQDEVYEAITKDYGIMRRGVLLQARAQNLDAVRESDRIAAEEILSSRVRAGHRLPRNYIKAAMIHQLGVLTLLDGKSYSNSDQRCIAIKAKALRFATEIGYWLRLQIKATQTPVHICNKLLQKLGLKGVAIARPGRRGEQRDSVYAIPDLNNPLRKRLLEAACSKLSSPVSVICNKDTDPIQITDTSPPNPKSVASKGGEIGSNLVGQLAQWGTSLSSWLITAVEGAIATIELSNIYGTQRRQVPLNELEVVA